MPIALSTTDTIELILEADKAKTNKPTFIFRFLTAKEYRQVSKLFYQSEELQQFDDIGQNIINGLKLFLIDWKNITGRDNQPIKYDPNKIEDVLTQVELVELRDRILGEMCLKEADLKKSVAVKQSVADSLPATVTPIVPAA